MKKSVCITFLAFSFMVSCVKTKVITYEEGIRRCEETRDSNRIQHPNLMLATSRNCIIGCKIPELNTETITGRKIDKDYFKGKAGIINFWFEGCPPCVKEIPDLNAIVEKFGKEKFYYLAIGRDSKDDISSFLLEHPWKFDQVVNGTELLEGKIQNIWGFPTTHIVNNEGVIIYSVGGIYEGNKKEIWDQIQSLVN